MAKILIIEDEVTLRGFIREFLEKAGHEVGIASDGDEGIRLFSESPYHVVITDILMPNKEGLETILELTQYDPDVKIIAISGGGVGLGDDLLDIAQEFGAKRALRKPIPMKDLLEMVEELLNE